MIHKVVHAEVVDGRRLQLVFNDGLEGEVDLREYVPFDGVFAPLEDTDFASRVKIDGRFGTVYWPNGADLDPEVLHSTITGMPLPKAGATMRTHGKRRSGARRGPIVQGHAAKRR